MKEGAHMNKKDIAAKLGSFCYETPLQRSGLPRVVETQLPRDGSTMINIEMKKAFDALVSINISIEKTLDYLTKILLYYNHGSGLAFKTLTHMVNKNLTIDQIKEMFSQVKDPQKESVIYSGRSFTKDNGLFIYKDYFERIIATDDPPKILKLRPDWDIPARKEAIIRRDPYSVKQPA